jgi:hypothetical protein
MADETIEIPVTTPGAEEGEKKFKNLRTQIKEVTVELQKLEAAGKTGTKEFKDYTDRLDKLNDAQARVRFQSGQLEDKLAALPGPVGQVGRSIQTAADAFATFGKSTTIALGAVGLVIGLFAALKKSLESTKEGQETLNRVTSAFAKVLGPILATLEKVAVPLFNGLAFILEKVAVGFSKFATALGIAPEKVKEATLSVDKVQQDANEKEKKRQEDLTKKNKEEEDKRLANRQKAAEKQKEIDEDNRRIAFEQEKKDLEYQLAESAKLQAKMKKLGLQTVQQATLEDQKKVYDEEQAREKRFQEDITKLKINTLDEQNAAIKKMGTPVLIQELEAQNAAYKKAKDAEKEYVKLTEEGKAQIVSNALGTLASAVGESTVAGKALSIAQATIDTYAGANKALATYPPPFGAIAAGTVVLAGLLNVKKILSVKVPKAGPNSAGQSAPSAPSINIATPSIGAPQIGATAGQTGTLASIVGGALNQNNSQLRPIQAYVVGNQVTSQQQLDRRVALAARLGG